MLLFCKTIRLIKRHSLILAVWILGTAQASAMGGVWVAEVTYEYKAKQHLGYVVVDFWARDLHTLENAEDTFALAWARYMEGVDSLDIFGQIIDQRRLAAAAKFPMHPFELVEGSRRRHALADIRNVQFSRTWERIDYMISVLTPLAVADTSWVGLEAELAYPIGSDVGCRLEVYSFQGSLAATDSEALAGLYSEDQETSRELQALLFRLKSQYTVVVELCGC